MCNILFRISFEPLCRMYARCLGDNPADPFMSFLCSIAFWRMHCYWPKFKNPKSFSEKVWHRMLYSRDPLFTMVSDKWRVRDYVTTKVGSIYLIPLLWHGDILTDIPFDGLPQQFVIKANHGCGYNIIVKDKTQVDIPNIKKQLKQWLTENFCLDKYLGTEWSYKNIQPHIIVESFIDDKGKIPLDYKFFCFAGRVEFVLMTFDRFGDVAEKHFDRSFTPLDLWNGAQQYEGEITRPANYEQMLNVADALARDFDFIRVDLYSVGDKIYFGELTCNPAGGLARFIPKEYDFIFGEKWKLKPA